MLVGVAGDPVEEDESDEDFIVVPIPDCFNPELPMSLSASTSIVIRKGKCKNTFISLCGYSQPSISHMLSSLFLFSVP
jgi:hypothetical protein